jgi:hypothetical protein
VYSRPLSLNALLPQRSLLIRAACFSSITYFLHHVVS